MDVDSSDRIEATPVADLAPHDLVSSLSLLVGFRDWAYRKEAVEALRMAPGAHVLEIGCGSGRNFPLLERAVGPQGAIVAIDASPGMVARARQRAARRGWRNIEVVLGDAVTYAFPQRLDAVLSTYTLVGLAEYEHLIAAAFQALKPGGRCAILDQKLPRGPASLLIPLVNLLSRPLPYSRVVAQRPAWEALRRHARAVSVRELYFGFAYLAVGEKAT